MRYSKFEPRTEYFWENEKNEFNDYEYLKHCRKVKIPLDSVLSTGINVDYVYNNECFIFLVAIRGDYEQFMTCVAYGAKLDTITADGSSIFSTYSIRIQRILSYIIDNVSIEYINTFQKHDRTPLMTLSHYGCPLVKKLIEKGAKIDAQNSKGVTALMFAAKNRQKDTVKLLVEEGANLFIKDEMGQMAVDVVGEYALLQDYTHLRGPRINLKEDEDTILVTNYLREKMHKH